MNQLLSDNLVILGVRFLLLLSAHACAYLFNESWGVLLNSLISFTPNIQYIEESAFLTFTLHRLSAFFPPPLLWATINPPLAHPHLFCPQSCCRLFSTLHQSGPLRCKSDPVSPMFKNSPVASHSHQEKVQILHYHNPQSPDLHYLAYHCVLITGYPAFQLTIVPYFR